MADPINPYFKPINPKDYQGVDFGAKDFQSGTAVPGQSGQYFVHNGQGWGVSDSPTGGAQAQPPGQPAPAPVPGVTTPTTTQTDVLQTAGTVGAQPTQGQPATIAGTFQQALLNRLAPQDLTANNPAIAGSIAANRNAESRGLAKTREALAERAATTGQSGAFDTNLRQAYGDSAGRQAAFEGNALQGLHQQQANDLTSALGMAGSMLNSQSGQDLQKYLAGQGRDLQKYGLDLDAALRREGLSSQSQLGNRGYDIQELLGKGNLNLGLLGLLQGNDQFNSNLAANLGMFNSSQSQNALLQLLGAL